MEYKLNKSVEKDPGIAVIDSNGYKENFLVLPTLATKVPSKGPKYTSAIENARKAWFEAIW